MKISGWRKHHRKPYIQHREINEEENIRENISAKWRIGSIEKKNEIARIISIHQAIAQHQRRGIQRHAIESMAKAAYRKARRRHQQRNNTETKASMAKMKKWRNSSEEAHLYHYIRRNRKSIINRPRRNQYRRNQSANRYHIPT